MRQVRKQSLLIMTALQLNGNRVKLSGQLNGVRKVRVIIILIKEIKIRMEGK